MITLMKEEKAVKFMRMALTQAMQFSKDESTKIAALALGREAHEIRSSGYNGMPRGCDDDRPERHARPEKYLWFEHAERNAIYNAARVGTPLAGSILIVTMAPCMDCSRAIVQAGIEGVIALEPHAEMVDRWGAHFEKSAELLSECGVELEWLRREQILRAASGEERMFWKLAMGEKL